VNSGATPPSVYHIRAVYATLSLLISPLVSISVTPDCTNNGPTAQEQWCGNFVTVYWYNHSILLVTVFISGCA
jgi:hypothetical protein